MHKGHASLLINSALFNWKQNEMKQKLIPPLLETDLKSAALINKPWCHSVGVWAPAPPWVGTSGSRKGSVILARAESRQDVCICYLQPSPGSRQRWRDITTTQSYLHWIVLMQPGSPDLGTRSCPPETGSDFWTEAKSDLCVEGWGSSLGKA